MFLLAMINGSQDYPEEPMAPVQPLAIDDALAAISYLRANADRWGLREDAIGALGFSAGGAVVTGAAMRGRDLGRPDFVGSIYGVPDSSGIPENAPPLFVLVTDDDPVVPALWGETLHRQWQAAGYSSELVRYPDGGHGFGMQEKGTTTDGWIQVFYEWLIATTARPTSGQDVFRMDSP